jgi:hypothetical protein
MKLLSAALICLAPLGVTATPASFWSSQDVISEAIPVKGNNPLEYCSDPSDNILDIKSVDLSPNPPKP